MRNSRLTSFFDRFASDARIGVRRCSHAVHKFVKRVSRNGSTQLANDAASESRAASFAGLRLGLTDGAVAVCALPNMKLPLLKVDVGPAESSKLRSPETGEHRRQQIGRQRPLAASTMALISSRVAFFQRRGLLGRCLFFYLAQPDSTIGGS